MKKSLLIALGCLALFSGCKKSDAVKPIDHLANIQSNILGTWHYQSLSIGYYVNGATDIYDNIASSSALQTAPYFTFSSGNVGSYVNASDNTQTKQFSYAITSTNGADSLICTGGLNIRFAISSISNTQLSISASNKETDVCHDRAGNEVITDLAKIVATLSKQH